MGHIKSMCQRDQEGIKSQSFFLSFGENPEVVTKDPRKWPGLLRTY